MKRKSLLTLFAVAAISALLFTSPAEAHRRHKHKGHKHHGVKVHKHHGVYIKSAPRVRYHHGPAFVVPRKIGRRNAAVYRANWGGEFFFRPHRHYHDIYVFPVHTRRGVFYREYEYCRGRLFIRDRAGFHGRRVSFSIGF
jgi:hypothetical protein